MTHGDYNISSIFTYLVNNREIERGASEIRHRAPVTRFRLLLPPKPHQRRRQSLNREEENSSLSGGHSANPAESGKTKIAESQPRDSCSARELQLVPVKYLCKDSRCCEQSMKKKTRAAALGRGIQCNACFLQCPTSDGKEGCKNRTSPWRHLHLCSLQRPEA